MNRANLRCLGLSVGIAIALAGCEPPTEPLEAGRVLEVVADGSTGCKYLAPRSIGGTGLTPKLRADGKPDCPKVQP